MVHLPTSWGMQTRQSEAGTVVTVALEVMTVSNHVHRGWHTQIDLSAVDFIMPGGIVAVACIARDSFQNDQPLQVTLPANDSVARYASRMGLGDALASCGLPGSLPAVNHHDRADTLLECQYADDASITDLSLLIGQRLDEAGVPHQVYEPLEICLFEVADNIRVHAQSGGGFLCAQTYQRGTNRERVSVAVGDIGVGIPATMQRHKPASDQHALELATTELVSGLNLARRGLGLHYLTRLIPKAGGRVTIRSGTAIRIVYPGGPYSTDVPPIPGTLVEIELPVARLGAGGAR